MTYARLGDLLLSVDLITEEQLDTALKNQKMTKKRLGQELIDEGIITEQQMIDALKLQLGVEYIDLSQIAIPPELSAVVPKSIAKKFSLVPVRMSKNTLYIAMNDPLNFLAVEEVKKATRKKVVPMITTSAAVEHAISTLYGNERAVQAIEEMRREMQEAGAYSGSAEGSFTSNTLGDDASSAPTVRLVNSIIERAVVERASDIHLEPYENELRVRMRIDGLMRTIMTVPKDLQASVISRLKIMGGMDISERKIPQDGRSNVRVKHSDIDLRMSTLPTIYGEKFVIRLLNKDSQLLDKEKIGLTGEDLKKYLYLIGNRSGVVLIVGPTGSGKSSTMYTMIRELNTDSVNLVTLEDPVEYNIPGINQVQINEKTGMTFAGGLRSILRQDPDIIAVGEIRDGETAEIAMRSAITGHLVLSTIHTNDAISTIDRLLDIGVAPYMISSALHGIISQRLVRRICPVCRKAYTPSADELAELGLPADSGKLFYKGEGCSACFGTGYRGRTGVFEILVMDRSLKSAVSGGAKRDEIVKIARDSGKFVSLEENCHRLVLDGTTTLEEARRIIGSVDY